MTTAAIAARRVFSLACTQIQQPRIFKSAISRTVALFANAQPTILARVSLQRTYAATRYQFPHKPKVLDPRANQELDKLDNMSAPAAAAAAAPAAPVDLDGLRAKTTRQGNKVRQLKKDGADKSAVIEAVNLLKELKITLAKAEEAEAGPKFDSRGLEDLLVQRMFWVPSFEIYGGVRGLFDYGPAGCALKNNVIDVWKRHFVLTEGMQEIECSTLTPHAVLKTSGHVDRFTDLMVKDVKTGECYRADKLLEDHIENLIKKDPGRADREELERTHRQADAYSPARQRFFADQLFFQIDRAALALAQLRPGSSFLLSVCSGNFHDDRRNWARSLATWPSKPRPRATT